ncbi:hypothetical protein [Chromobacterium haemolyticum]|uniref:hypothetical protein n=1 Tax=Chromobacterium haemolyticum TaxID=394935 RepID=UPI000592BDEE|nr:hypothetical protein [Chromobacterium haemolyticum]
MREDLNVLAGNEDGLTAGVTISQDELAKSIARILYEYAGQGVSETRGMVVKRRIASAVAELTQVVLFNTRHPEQVVLENQA